MNGSTLVVAPIAVPLIAAVLLLWIEAQAPRWLRLCSGLSLLIGVVVAATLSSIVDVDASGVRAPGLHAVGDWVPPFGIVLVADGLSTLMVLLTAVVVGISVWQSMALGIDLAGRHYHTLVQLQIMGLNGAFLTGDFFNLFVFFEVLLLASYGLLLQGGAERQLRPGLHYVVINLLGSALFLLGAGLLYGAAGTLNMADLARRLPDLEPQAGQLTAVACTLLGVVFALKGAVGPLGLWLPGVYTRLPGGVAILFALMTKVGLYALLRLYVDVLAAAPEIWLAGARMVLWCAGVLAMAMAAFLVLGVSTLSGLAAAVVLISSGTVLTALSFATVPAISATLYYLVHSTLATALLFALADLLRRERPQARDDFTSGESLSPALRAWLAIGLLAVSGLPPFSGFIAKFGVLAGSLGHSGWGWFWLLVLVAGLATLARSADAWLTIGGGPRAARPASFASLCPVAVLAILGVAIALAAAPVQQWGLDAARQIESGTSRMALDVDVHPRTGGHP
ncbi:MAG TPA: monovalent cation/H+ antiporter subunit D [Gammaproteobacteria bacterium]|nr:monovalent cation/H+ antiporter subunit D [Gammaproteobacteria bacterium]